MAVDPERIEGAIDRAVLQAVQIDDSRFGLEMKTLVDAMEFAKLMAISKQAIPMYLRNEPGLCAAIVTRSLRWGVDPFFVAEQSYLTVNPKTKEEKIAFMSQLFNAVINRAEPLILEGKLRVRYLGEGLDKYAEIYGIPKHETEAIVFTTPTVGERIKQIGRNEGGYLKGSPLYDSDPEQALWYYGSRGFIRRYFPHVLAGAYSGEELEEAGHERMRDVTPQQPEKPKPGQALVDRLQANRKNAARGFDPKHIEREHGQMTGGGEGGAKGAATTEEPAHGSETEGGSGDAAGRRDDQLSAEGRHAVADGSGNADDANAGGRSDQANGQPEGGAAGGSGAEAQQELLPPEEQPRRGRGRVK